MGTFEFAFLTHREALTRIDHGCIWLWCYYPRVYPPLSLVCGLQRRARAEDTLKGNDCEAVCLIAVVGHKAVEGHRTVETSNFVVKAIGTQQVADASARSNDTKHNTPGNQIGVQFMQHSRAGKVDMR
jgi:hypothetical protein